MSRWGVLTLRILDLLEHVGPMTAAELSRELGVDRDNLGKRLKGLRQPTVRPKAPRQVRIVDWRDEDEGSRCYLRPVYGLGSKPDAVKPPRKSHNELKRRYRAAKRARMSFLAPIHPRPALLNLS